MFRVVGEYLYNVYYRLKSTQSRGRLVKNGCKQMEYEDKDGNIWFKLVGDDLSNAISLWYRGRGGVHS